MIAQSIQRPVELTRFRPGRRWDCRRIAELFRISSDGVADYIWSQLAAAGESLLDVGERRYARTGTEFSFENCLLAELGGVVVGMLHSYPVRPDAGRIPVPDDIDPVLRPYAELECPGSLYISGMAVLPGHRGAGLGGTFLGHAEQRAITLGCPALSLIAFEQNTGAVRLYERSGFRVADRRPVVPHPLIHFGGHALLMVRRL